MSVPKDLASACGMSQEDIQKILSHKVYYKHSIKKKNKKLRVLYEPNEELMKLQHRLYENVLKDFDLCPGINGVPKTSIRDYINPHVEKDYVLVADVKRYFPSVKRKYVLNGLEFLNALDSSWYSPIASMVTYRGTLPQGAPTSAFMAGIAIQPIFTKLNEYAKSVDVDITVYVDDWAISGNDSKAVLKVFARLKRQMSKYDLFFSENKTHYMKVKEKQEIMGIMVGYGLKITSRYQEEVRKDICNLKNEDEFTKDDNIRSIKGKLNFIKSFDKQTFKELNKLYTKEIEA